MGMPVMNRPDVARWDKRPGWFTSASMVERIAWAERLFPGVGQQGVVHLQSYPLFANDPTSHGAVEKLMSIFDAPLPQSKVSKLVDAADKTCHGRVDESNANETAQAITKLIFACPEFQFC